MSTAVQSLLEDFDQLSDREKREAAVEILRRTKASETGPLSDEELTALADELFLELDAHEAKS